MIRLNKSIQSAVTRDANAGRSFLPSAANGICSRLGDKWTVQVIWQLSLSDGHRLRFSALKKAIDGIAQRMLTLTLRNLERDGFVERHYFPEVPPRVEYELTEMGIGILQALEGVNFWITDNLAGVEANRRAYDAER